MTERLFDADAMLSDFDAEVLSCNEAEGHFETVLDRTAFFPEGGGQSSDTGWVDGKEITHVFESDGVIYHVSGEPIEVGKRVSCRIEFSERFRKMQNHTGEHVFSGLVHSMFGYDNVGFHLSDEYIRVDYDGALTGKDVRVLEDASNSAIAENRVVKAWYPDREELSRLEYRSKKELSGNIRIVSVEGVDICACCAPHVARTGEIGMLKVVDFMNYKGGTRLFAVCGVDALRLFQKEHGMLTEIANSLSASRDDVPAAFEKMRAEATALRRKNTELLKKTVSDTVKRTRPSEGPLCFFLEGADDATMRMLANGTVSKCPMTAVFSKDGERYRYIIASEKVDLKAASRDINAAISGKGGGSPVMIQGTALATESEIREYFESGCEAR